MIMCAGLFVFFDGLVEGVGHVLFCAALSEIDAEIILKALHTFPYFNQEFDTV